MSVGKRAQSQAATRARILEAARAAFAAHGYEGAALREIARNARATCGAIFSNFAGKADLYRAVHGYPPVSADVGAALLGALKGVVAVADRKTAEFDAAHAAIALAEGRGAPSEAPHG